MKIALISFLLPMSRTSLRRLDEPCPAGNRSALVSAPIVFNITYVLGSGR
jgi:hypothetical protein